MEVLLQVPIRSGLSVEHKLSIARPSSSSPGVPGEYATVACDKRSYRSTKCSLPTADLIIEDRQATKRASWLLEQSRKSPEDTYLGHLLS